MAPIRSAQSSNCSLRLSASADSPVTQGVPLTRLKPSFASSTSGPIARGLQRCRPATAFAVNSGVTRAEQHQSDVRHVREISHRPVRGHLGYAVAREQCEQAFDHLGPHAGIPVREVIDRGRDDRTNRGRLERRPHRNRVAHDDVARQLP